MREISCDFLVGPAKNKSTEPDKFGHIAYENKNASKNKKSERVGAFLSTGVARCFPLSPLSPPITLTTTNKILVVWNQFGRDVNSAQFRHLLLPNHSELDRNHGRGIDKHADYAAPLEENLEIEKTLDCHRVNLAGWLELKKDQPKIIVSIST